MTDDKRRGAPNRAADVGETLAAAVGDAGVVEDFLGGYRICVFHGSAFPWHEVFKTLLVHDFKVSVAGDAELLIEAQP